MSGIMDLNVLLQDMQPVLGSEEFIFCSMNKKLGQDIIDLNPLCLMQEEEGLTLILSKTKADEAGIKYEGVYQKITLLIHSSLEAVGLTAAFAKALTESNISANVVAGYYHDHIFVQKEKAEDAMVALLKLTEGK